MHNVELLNITETADSNISNKKAENKKEKIKVDKLNAFFGNVKALNNISLSFSENTVTAIIGPSGCGKSTLLRCINRMHEEVSGTYEGIISLDDENIKDNDPVWLRRKIGMIFQKPNPFPTMSIMDNVTAGLRLNGIRNRSKLKEIAEQSLRQAFLWDEVKDILKQPGIALSGGQQQRLCIARTLAVSPEVILMDEPASALDPLSTNKIEELIFELKKSYTVIIVTHNMQQAARVSDYTAFMYLGELVEYNKTANIFTNPSNKRTEEYVTGRFG
ncbi:MAG: phosphate ABC transporter ATP-binding protein PstB [Bacteroidota bacterium]|nr:phosphate ABC transporter ATP-binding protein PstB [Bacteroidota bacterium]